MKVFYNQKCEPNSHQCDCGEIHIWPDFVAKTRLVHTCDVCHKETIFHYGDIVEEKKKKKRKGGRG